MFLEPKLLVLARSTLPARQRQRPDPVQHVAEQPAVQMPPGQQQPIVPRVLDQPTTRLHQAVLQARQRPALDPVRQPEPPPQVAQVVGRHAELQPYLVGPETMTRQAGPVRGLFAFLDPLLRRAALVGVPTVTAQNRTLSVVSRTP